MILNKIFKTVYAESGLTFADTSRHDPYKKFKFLVEISGDMVFAKAGFKSVSGLSADTDVIEYREGGDSSTVTKFDGLSTYENITLERGMSEDEDMYKWATKKVDGRKIRANMIIKLLDNDDSVVKEWEVPDCWVKKYDIGDMDGTSSDTIFETIEVVHEGFELL